MYAEPPPACRRVRAPRPHLLRPRCRRDGADRLARYGIEASDHVFVYGQPDHGPSADRDFRRRTFLGLPLSWTPTTWVFNREGKLAYAFNYGEVSNEMLALAIEHARDEWMHD